MRLLSLDPGETSGYAILRDGMPIQVGEIHIDDLNAFLHAIALDDETIIDHIALENFRIRPPNPRKKEYIPPTMWGEVPTIRIIGRVQFWAWLHDIPITFQEAAIKPTAYGLAGLPYKPGAKNAHITDAVAHGRYWWIKNGARFKDATA